MLVRGDQDWIWNSDGHRDYWDFRDNIIIDFQRQANDMTTSICDYNAYYDALQSAKPGTNNLINSNISDSNNATLYILIKRIIDPEIIEIPFERNTLDSPHYNFGDSMLDSVPDKGVSNDPILYRQEDYIPDIPKNLYAARIFTNRIDLSWNLNSRNERFVVIERKLDVDGSYDIISIIDGGKESYSDLDVDDSNYFYRVIAIGGLGGAGYSDESQSY